MAYHRHVLSVTQTFLEKFGAVPPHAALYVCENENDADTLRGKAPLPRLLGTEAHNMRDEEQLVEFADNNPGIRAKMQSWQSKLLTAKELQAKLLNGGTQIPAAVEAYIRNAKNRKDLYKLGGAFKPRFAGLTTMFQDAGNFLSHGLLEVHVCVEGVATWRPMVKPTELPLYRRYAPGDPVSLGPPGGYSKETVGTIVDFLDENVARLHVKPLKF